MKRLFLVFVTALLLGGGLWSCEKDNAPNNTSSTSSSGSGTGNVDNPGSGQSADGWVDLGLPSGLLWAECNVGASSPEAYGDYFAWGETAPKEVYNWSTYVHANGDYDQLTKYCSDSFYSSDGSTDDLTLLQPSDDAATANLGNGARIPTKGEWEELLANTNSVWEMQNGIMGRTFTASNGKSIFLPAAGSRWDDNLNSEGQTGYYWSSTLCAESPDNAWDFDFHSSYQGVNDHFRRGRGFSVRAVRSAH